MVLSLEAEEIYLLLKNKSKTSKKERSIINAISRKIELIKEDPEIGESLGKNLIPKEYIEKYKINNLRRIELPCYWRMLYYLTSNNEEIEIIAFVLDILDHHKYNKKFKYKQFTNSWTKTQSNRRRIYIYIGSLFLYLFN